MKKERRKEKTQILMRSVLITVIAFLVFAQSMPCASYADSVATDNGGSAVQTVIPGGMPFGVKLQTKGVVVVGISPLDDSDDGVCPASKAGIKTRDVIIGANGKEINSIDDFSKALDDSGGKEIRLSVVRERKEIKVGLIPVKSEKDGHYKAGIWVRDGAAGIGTVTFICPDEHFFAGLGHGICDPDTGILMPMSHGTVYDVSIGSIRKGKEGTPGELRGFFSGPKTGALLANTEYGTFGMLSVLPKSTEKPIGIADPKDVKCGEACILCTLDNNRTEKYSVSITKIIDRNRDSKNFVIRVTDKRLLEKTGGIVQGMSGSPIIQDGKLVGAITHVFVNEPQNGYGIFAKTMLEKSMRGVS